MSSRWAPHYLPQHSKSERRYTPAETSRSRTLRYVGEVSRVSVPLPWPPSTGRKLCARQSLPLSFVNGFADVLLTRVVLRSGDRPVEFAKGDGADLLGLFGELLAIAASDITPPFGIKPARITDAILEHGLSGPGAPRGIDAQDQTVFDFETSQGSARLAAIDVQRP
jgi:hypothetical protein